MDQTVEQRFGAFKKFYATGVTKNKETRREYLKKLHDSIVRHEEEIAQALYQDLRKSPEESYISETGIVLAEIRQQLKNMTKWARGRCVKTPLFLLPSSSRIIYEPKGVVLIIAPWNYPFQLTLDPLVGAIAAGNCVALKPSTTSAATCRIIKKIISEVFPEEYVYLFDGDHAQSAELLACRFDHIFFTGGTGFGRTVMECAAKNLVPVTLELGGKSPCIVDREADLEIAARKITWGKLINAGQTCIAPDYLFVHKEVRSELIEKIKSYIERFYGSDIRHAENYPRIISDRAFARLQGYIDEATILYGGETDAADRYVAPTLIDSPALDSPVMQEEIFGPILPILEFEQIDDVIAFINSREKPLAFYYFGTKRRAREVLGRTTSGGACINDTIVHIANPHLPFGGTGFSGMGSYHGRYSFETFSNMRGTVFSKRHLDITLRYPPYKKHFGLLKRVL